MSRRDRRDHAIVVGVGADGSAVCIDCGDPIRTALHRPTGRWYWRHLRRPR